MKVLEENIESIIPQRNPFVMISNLIDADENFFETNFFIHPNNLFIKKGLLQEAALIENIAQTCAAGFGYLNSKAGRQTMLGFIGAITKLKVYSLPKIDTSITTIVNVTHQLENIYLVKGTNYYLGKELLECEMKIVIN